MVRQSRRCDRTGNVYLAVVLEASSTADADGDGDGDGDGEEDALVSFTCGPAGGNAHPAVVRWIVHRYLAPAYALQSGRHEMTHHKAGGALLALLLGLSSVATACGGGGGDEASSGGVDPAPEVSPGDEGSDAPEGSEAPAGDQGDEPSGDGLVTVVIDGTSHELDVDAGMTSQCEVFAGEAMIGAGTGRDPAPTTLAFEFAIGNAATGPSYITITADDGSYEWVAGTNDGRTFEEGTSQVDEVTVEGETATGTATFIDAASEERSPVEGSFDITCP